MALLIKHVQRPGVAVQQLGMPSPA